jgi:hypothetical protein
MTNHTDFITLTDLEQDAIAGGSILSISLSFVVPVVIGILIAAGTEIIRDWSGFTSGLSQGAAAAKSW